MDYKEPKVGPTNKKSLDKTFHNKNKLKCTYTNADGILKGNKYSEILNYIDVHNPDVFFVTETKLKTDDVLVHLDNYNIFRKDRMNSLGGGVLILTKKMFHCEIVDNFIWENGEILVIKMVINFKTIHLCVVYRPPGTGIECLNVIRDTFEYLSSLSGQVIVTGDFNFKNIDWVEGTLKIYDNLSHLFFESIGDNFFTQNVVEVTRVRGNNEPSLLDLIITKSPLEVENLVHRSPFGLSDHCVLDFEFLLNDGGSDAEIQPMEKRNYFRANWTGMHNFVSCVDWQQEFMNKNLDEKWSSFKDIYDLAISRFVPIKNDQNLRGKNNKKWINYRAKRNIMAKEAAWNHYLKRKTPYRYRLYQIARNKATFEVRSARKKFEESLSIEVKSNPRAFYGYVRSLTNIKETVGNLKRNDGSLTSDNHEKCNILNEAFGSVFINEDPNIPTIGVNVDSSISNIDFTTHDIVELLRANKSNSSGPDGVHPMVLRECSVAFSYPLYLLFRESLDEAHLPEDWRKSNIIPIFKKGNKSEALNYRPISITSIVVRTLERIIKTKLVQYLDRNNLISPDQHGFRSKRSTVTQLLEYLEDITSSLDSGEPVDAVYLDCRKAFDTVPHRRLIAKTNNMGV